MARRSSVTALPQEVLLELQTNLVASRFSNYHLHADWLLNQGYKVSKSAIHRYATEYELNLLGESTETATLSNIEVRLRCLEVAASLKVGTDNESLTKQAEDFLKWIYR